MSRYVCPPSPPMAQVAILNERVKFARCGGIALEFATPAQ
jgi:hypothetical protein